MLMQTFKKFVPTRERFSTDWFLPQLLMFCVVVPVIILTWTELCGKHAETSLLAQLTANGNYLGSDKDGFSLRFNNHNRLARIDLSLPGKSSRTQKIRFDYTGTSNIRALSLDVPQDKPPKDPDRHNNRIIDGNNGTFTFGLNDGDSRQNVSLVLHSQSSKAPMVIRISAIGLSEKQFIDSNLFFLILMLGVGASLVGIGCISGAFLQKACRYDQRTSGLFVLLGLFVYSTILLLALLALQALTAEKYPLYLTLFAVVLLLTLVVYNSFGGGRQQQPFFPAIKTPVAAYLVFTLIVAILIGCIDGIALQEYYWSVIGRYRMFDGHTAHDNVFQYLNALAIADNRTFNSLYQSPPLVFGLLFGVEDRQVLMGAIIGAYQVVWSLLSVYTVKTFAFFTIMGSCFSLFIVFPLYAFFEIYFRRHIVVLALFLLLMTTFVLGNIYYTWFKILGGAFILAGVYFLHLYKEPLKSWIIAGVFWALSLNMHAGQVIIYPLLALYFFFVHIKTFRPAAISRSALFTLMLTVIVIAGILPWEMIKHAYFPDDGELFRLHLLGGEKYAGSTFETVRNFLSRYTFAEQLSQRTEQLVDALRIKDINIWIAKYSTWHLKDYLMSWNRLQFRYIPFMTYPLVLLFAVTYLAGKVIRTSWTANTAADRDYRGVDKMFFLSFACVIWGFVFMFTHYEAVSSSFVSQFATLFILMFFYCRIAAYSRLGLALMLLYAAMSFAKLYIYFSRVVDFTAFV